MDTRFGATTEIECPIEDVFAYLADGENDSEFSSRVLEIKKTTGGTPGVGTVYASTVRDGGLKTQREFEVTEFEKPTRIRWRELSGKAPIVVPAGGYDMAPTEDGGTELTLFNELRPNSTLGKLILPLALRSARRGAGELVASIKREIEAG